ncbi:MAG: hypothetical protein HQL41_03160 [Alphaproteobacteria bacterium]|nr:hypothetical protein [Alphaproteobacteria bacterium]
MLTLGPTQMEELKRAATANFVRAATEFLRARDADASKAQFSDVQALVEAQMEKAFGYGLRTRRQTMAYILTGWLIGGDFDVRFPAARIALSDPDSTAELKTEWLRDWTVELIRRLER